MSLPDVSQTAQDYGLAAIASKAQTIFAKIGYCSGGTPNVVSSWNGPNLKPMQDAWGYGPLVEACAHSLKVAGGPIVGVPVTGTNVGTAGAVTHTGTGTSVMTVVTSSIKPRDSFEVQVQITRAGASLAAATAAFRYSLDGGDIWSTEIAIPITGAYNITSAGISLLFAAGTFVVDDLYTFSTTAPAGTISDIQAAFAALLADPREWNWVHIVGAPAPSLSSVTPPTGGTPPAITLTGTPTAFVDAIVRITTGGTRGTAKFEVSLDNGATYGTEQTTSDGTPTYAIPGTGITLNYAAGTYVHDDLYTFNSYGSIAALFAAVDVLMTSAETAYRYAGCVLELPDTTDAILLKATASLSSTRIMYAGGYCELASSVAVPGGATYKRSDAWPLAARRAKAPIHEDLGRVASGSLPGVSSLHRDENATPAFGAARIATLRTITDYPGFFSASDTVGDMMAPAGSDYSLSQYRTVMDRALKINRGAMMPYLNDTIPLNPKTGYIQETAARAIEGKVNGTLEADLLTGAVAHVTAVVSTVKRDEQIGVTRNLTTDVAIVPLSTSKTITSTVHYTRSLG